MQGTDEQARWEQYLFKEHSREQLAAWARRLAFFRFCRAWGGQANDADQLLVAFRIDSEDDLLDVLGILGIPEKRVPHVSNRGCSRLHKELLIRRKTIGTASALNGIQKSGILSRETGL